MVFINIGKLHVSAYSATRFRHII